MPPRIARTTLGWLTQRSGERKRCRRRRTEGRQLSNSLQVPMPSGRAQGPKHLSIWSLQFSIKAGLIDHTQRGDAVVCLHAGDDSVEPLLCRLRCNGAALIHACLITLTHPKTPIEFSALLDDGVEHFRWCFTATDGRERRVITCQHKGLFTAVMPANELSP